MHNLSRKQLYQGVFLAVLATAIWAGNFIVARGIADKIPPFSLAFYRWSTATILMLPVGWTRIRTQLPLVRKHFKILLLAAVTGVAIFNTFIYIAGHHTSAINMALIGTTSSPVFVIIISAWFFHEKIRPIRIAGLLFCIAGIVVLLSKGSWQTLAAFQFGKGDVWVLLSALSFAVYNISVKRKPKEIASRTFLFTIFLLGTLVLLPFFLVEKSIEPPVQWNSNLLWIILYLGLGTSVIAFLLWNEAIRRVGAVRTSLFGNLIPIFASIEAIWILGESLTVIHFISGGLVIIGLILANSRKANQPHTAITT
jgi:drug/metabolite transporter (DMT)-like permease